MIRKIDDLGLLRQELLRHGDPRLTAGTYMDDTRLETASLIEKLPDYQEGKDTDTQLVTQTSILGFESPPLRLFPQGFCEADSL